MKVYVAGPMRGRPFFNFPAFDAARDGLIAQGHEVVSPADLDRQIGFDPYTLDPDWDWNTLPAHFNLADAIARDLAAIQAVDAYWALPGWENSLGASAEIGVLRWRGCKWLNETTETILQEAARIVHGARRDFYGHPIDNHGCTAELWAAWLNRRFGHRLPLEAEDVCHLLILQKESREAHQKKRDNIVDICGYAANVELCQEARSSRNGKST